MRASVHCFGEGPGKPSLLCTGCCHRTRHPVFGPGIQCLGLIYFKNNFGPVSLTGPLVTWERHFEPLEKSSPPPVRGWGLGWVLPQRPEQLMLPLSTDPSGA